jgi:hypothetical protein
VLRLGARLPAATLLFAPLCVDLRQDRQFTCRIATKIVSPATKYA